MWAWLPTHAYLAAPCTYACRQSGKDAANEQHYEVSAEFYRIVLGPRLKYSSGLWHRSNSTFEESEVAMLELYCVRAQLQDGLKVTVDDVVVRARRRLPSFPSSANIRNSKWKGRSRQIHEIHDIEVS